MVKKLMLIVFAITNFIFMSSFNYYPVSNNVIPEVSAKAAVLIDASTGKVLFEKNAYDIRQMASTTKIMTTLLCLESGNLDRYFTVDTKAINVEGSTMGLVNGDIVTKRILCYGMMLPSGNDAANAAAVRIAGSNSEFAKLMNQRAKQIGMKNTNFVTPSGLDDYIDNHYSTAYDMALLAREAMKNETFAKICATKKIKIDFGNPPYGRWLLNSNKLLNMCEGCIGVKTGFTDKAKRCLVSACERNGSRLICVTLSAPDDWNDHIKMYNYGYSRLINVKMQQEDISVDVVGGTKDFVDIVPQGDTQLILTDVNAADIKQQIVIEHFLYAPVKKGQVVGKLEYLIGNEVIKSVNLVANENIEYKYSEKKLSWVDKFKQKFFDK